MNNIPAIELSGVSMGMAGSYKLQVIDPHTGIVVEDRPWCKNLILNSGMNALVSQQVGAANRYGIAGTGSRPNVFDAGTSMITQSGANVYLEDVSGFISDFTVATASYSQSLQNGDTLQYANGSQSLVLSVDGPRQATVRPTYSIDLAGAQTFKIWKTSQPDLQLEIRRSTGYLVGSSSIVGWNCGTQFSCSTTVARRTYNFAEETVGYTYTEVGVSWTNVKAASSSFARALVVPPLTVAAGFQLRMTHDLKVTWGPREPRYFTASIDGWSSPLMATESILNFPGGASYCDDAGSTIGGSMWEPVAGFTTNHGNTGGGMVAFVGTDGSPLPNFSASGVGRGGTNYMDDAVYQYPTYVQNTFTRYKQAYYSITTAVNANLRCIAFGDFYGGGFGSPQYPWYGGRTSHCVVLDTPQEKTSLQKMYLSWKHTWARDLS